MTKEEKIKKRQQAAYVRKSKRVVKDAEYAKISYFAGRNSISWGRRKSQGKIFSCEMDYYDCERRGYCNGDC